MTRREDPPPERYRPYTPQAVVTLLDGQQFSVACESLMACAEFAEFVITQGFRMVTPEGFRLWPAHQVLRVRVRKIAK